jgi:hypothetical protein
MGQFVAGVMLVALATAFRGRAVAVQKCPPGDSYWYGETSSGSDISIGCAASASDARAKAKRERGAVVRSPYTL